MDRSVPSVRQRPLIAPSSRSTTTWPRGSSPASRTVWCMGGALAVLPILHLNGYKIANPTVLARIPRHQLAELPRGYGWSPHFVEGDDPAQMHVEMARTLDTVERATDGRALSPPLSAASHSSSPPPRLAGRTATDGLAPAY